MAESRDDLSQYNLTVIESINFIRDFGKNSLKEGQSVNLWKNGCPRIGGKFPFKGYVVKFTF